MCGIIGFVGKGNIKEVVEKGLKLLEYRGYDSCGYGIVENGQLKIKKEVGKNKIEKLVSDLPSHTEDDILIIAHTRWATHGKVTISNTHPHTDCSREIAVVHNGIIENFRVAKENLEKKGHKFFSETDSEIIPHLIEEYLNNYDFESSFYNAIKEIEGTFAIVGIYKREKKFFLARKFSPLCIGKVYDGFIIASDFYPILNWTDKVYYLEDNEIAIIDTDKKIKIKNLITGERKKISFSSIVYGYEKIEKGSYESFMLKEIFEQPEIIKKTKENFLENIEIYEKILKNCKPLRIIMTGCGTSWHAGLIGEYIFEEILQIPTEVEYASEFRYRNSIIYPEDVVIAISQSGETADTLGTLKKIKGKCLIFSICNVYGSSIARESDFTFFTKAGPEIGVASTKAFTTQITVLYLLSLLWGKILGKIDSYEFERKNSLFNSIPEKIAEILEKYKLIEEISENIVYKTNALYLGRGIQFPVALEGALKLKEISYIHAEGYPAAEMKHGPIALIDENMPVIFIAVRDKLYQKIISNMEEIKSRGGSIITITDKKDKTLEKLSWHVVEIPEIDDDFMKPLLTVIPLQLLAYFTATKKGCDVDKPRNLAKSVTVE